MKRILFAALAALSLLVTIAGCSSAELEPDWEPTTTTSTTSSAPSTKTTLITSATTTTAVEDGSTTKPTTTVKPTPSNSTTTKKPAENNATTTTTIPTTAPPYWMDGSVGLRPNPIDLSDIGTIVSSYATSPSNIWCISDSGKLYQANQKLYSDTNKHYRHIKSSTHTFKKFLIYNQVLVNSKNQLVRFYSNTGEFEIITTENINKLGLQTHVCDALESLLQVKLDYSSVVYTGPCNQNNDAFLLCIKNNALYDLRTNKLVATVPNDETIQSIESFVIKTDKNQYFIERYITNQEQVDTYVDAKPIEGFRLLNIYAYLREKQQNRYDEITYMFIPYLASSIPPLDGNYIRAYITNGNQFHI